MTNFFIERRKKNFLKFKSKGYIIKKIKDIRSLKKLENFL